MNLAAALALVLASDPRLLQDPAPPCPRPELRLQLSSPYREVLAWEPLPMTLSVTNVGTMGVPFCKYIWSGSYEGTSLTLVVEDLDGPADSLELVPEPSLGPPPCCSPSRPTFLLERGAEQSASFAIGGTSRAVPGERVGEVRYSCVPAFPHAGRYEIRARYRHGDADLLGDPLFVVVNEPSGQAARALEFLKTLGSEAVWLYEVQLSLELTSEKEARFIHLAEDFGVNVYSDHARYALATLHARWALLEAFPREDDRLERAARGVSLLDGIGTPDFKFAEDARQLRASLAERERQLRSKRR